MGRFRMPARRSSLVAAAVVLAGAGLTALPALAGSTAAATSTTVGPAGHNYTAALVAGSTASFLVGTTTVNCNQSGTTGAVPAEPGNTSADGPVSSALSPATFANNGGACPTNVLFTTARTVSNATNGSWTIGLSYDPAGSTGTMTIPQAGVVTTISGLASCVVTVAPDGPVSFSGPWLQGDGTTVPVLDFSAGVALPIRVTGGLTCPTGATAATFTARYTVADSTDPAQRITVSPGPAAPTAEPSATTADPTVTPSDPPTGEPSDPPTGEPSDPPTGEPSDPPTGEPSDPPTA